MTNTRYQHGLDKMMEYTLTDNKEISTHLKISEELGDLAPGLENYIVEFAYGDIYTREGLTNQQRAIITISSLATLGTEPQLELHINTALTAGVTPKEIVETVMHLIPYAGFPRVLNALQVIKKVFAQRNVEMDEFEFEPQVH